MIFMKNENEATCPSVRLSYILVAYGLFLVIASLIPILGSMNKVNINLGAELRLDYIVHFCAYSGFFVLPVVLKWFGLVDSQKIPVAKIFIFTILLAISTEILQGMTTFRTFNIYDILFNVFGIIFGFIFWLLFR